METLAEVNLEELREAGNTAAHATQKRNELILQARLDGWPWATIADMTGLTVNGVEKIAERMNNGIRPVPRTRQKP